MIALIFLGFGVACISTQITAREEFDDYICFNCIHKSKTGRNFCESIGQCPPMYSRRRSESPVSLVDVRVAKGYGSRGYDKLRISVVSDSEAVSAGENIFTYASQFKYRWTQNFLTTGLVTVVPGKEQVYVINGVSINITIPSDNVGVRGVLIADPCFQSTWINCQYKDTFKTFDRVTQLLNAIFLHDDISYWGILGDNFYDQSGDPTSDWFAALSQNTKSSILISAPGNHDYWVGGAPSAWSIEDQQGNGFMQFYGQDVAAAALSSSNSPYDFSVNPDVNASAQNLPPLTNFFSYYKVGNTAFFVYSGGYSLEDSKPYFQEACRWAVKEQPAVILLVGHWNFGGDGCDLDMAVPFVYSEVSLLPDCQLVADRMSYVMGHTHRNMMTRPNKGYLVAGQGEQCNF